MPSQETDHVSPTEVTPELGKEALGTWWLFLGRMAAGLINPAQTQVTAQEARLWSNRKWRGCMRTE